MESAKNILVVRNDHIGDLVLSTGVFREIKKNIPNSKLTLIVSKINKPIVEKNKYIDEIIELEIPRYNFKTILNFFRMSRILRKRRFDFGIDLRGSLMNAFFLLFLSGVKTRISRRDIHPSISIFLNRPVDIPQGKHIIEDNLFITNKGLGINASNPSPQIITDHSDKMAVGSFIKRNNLKKFICICPLAGLEFKQWPLKKFKVLIEKLSKSYPSYKILLLGLEKDRELMNQIATRQCRVVCNFNVRQMVLLFKKSSLIIAQDGGPLTIAWISGTKVIALIPKGFNNQTPARDFEKVKPLKNSTIINSKKIESMDGIGVDYVFSQIESELIKLGGRFV